jgi:hypothetical protein
LRLLALVRRTAAFQKDHSRFAAPGARQEEELAVQHGCSAEHNQLIELPHSYFSQVLNPDQLTGSKVCRARQEEELAVQHGCSDRHGHGLYPLSYFFIAVCILQLNSLSNMFQIVIFISEYFNMLHTKKTLFRRFL